MFNILSHIYRVSYHSYIIAKANFILLSQKHKKKDYLILLILYF